MSIRKAAVLSRWCLLVTLMVVIAGPHADADDPSVDGGNNTFFLYDQTSTDVVQPQTSTSQTDQDPYVEVVETLFCDRDPELQDFYGCGGPQECGENGLAYNQIGITADGSEDFLGQFCAEPGEVTPESPGLTLTMVREAFRRVPLPDSEISVQPPGGRTLVNIATILSTEAEPFVESLTLLGQNIRLDIEPTRFRWIHGDGSEQQTDWPGITYAKSRPMDSYLTHTYLRASRDVPVRVDTTWSARFSVNGGPWRPVPDTVTIEGDPVALDVLEASPVLVGYQ